MNLTDKTDARANETIVSEATWIKTFFRLIKIGLNKGGDVQPTQLCQVPSTKLKGEKYGNEPKNI